MPTPQCYPKSTKLHSMYQHEENLIKPLNHTIIISRGLGDIKLYERHVIEEKISVKKSAAQTSRIHQSFRYVSLLRPSSPTTTILSRDMRGPDVMDVPLRRPLPASRSMVVCLAGSTVAKESTTSSSRPVGVR